MLRVNRLPPCVVYYRMGICLSGSILIPPYGFYVESGRFNVMNTELAADLKTADQARSCKRTAKNIRGAFPGKN